MMGVISIEFDNENENDNERFQVDDLEFHLENDYSGVAEVTIYESSWYDEYYTPNILASPCWNAEELIFIANAFNRMANKLEKYK